MSIPTAATIDRTDRAASCNIPSSSSPADGLQAVDAAGVAPQNNRLESKRSKVRFMATAACYLSEVGVNKCVGLSLAAQAYWFHLALIAGRVKRLPGGRIGAVAFGQATRDASMSERLGCSVRTVKRARSELVEAGLIDTKRWVRGQELRLLLPDAAASSEGVADALDEDTTEVLDDPMHGDTGGTFHGDTGGTMEEPFKIPSKEPHQLGGDREAVVAPPPIHHTMARASEPSVRVTIDAGGWSGGGGVGGVGASSASLLAPPGGVGSAGASLDALPIGVVPEGVAAAAELLRSVGITERWVVPLSNEVALMSRGVERLAATVERLRDAAGRGKVGSVPAALRALIDRGNLDRLDDVPPPKRAARERDQAAGGTASGGEWSRFGDVRFNEWVNAVAEFTHTTRSAGATVKLPGLLDAFVAGESRGLDLLHERVQAVEHSRRRGFLRSLEDAIEIEVPEGWDGPPPAMRRRERETQDRAAQASSASSSGPVRLAREMS